MAPAKRTDGVECNLGVEEHVLSDRQAQLGLGRLQCEAEQPRVVAEVLPVRQLKRNLLACVERDLHTVLLYLCIRHRLDAALWISKCSKVPNHAR